MSDPRSGIPPSGERWNVNMPAVIGVVFVFLLGVVVWVLVSNSGDDVESNSATPTLPAAGDDSGPAAVAGDGDAVTETTTPAPMPSTSVVATPAPTTPASTAPPTSPAPTVASTVAGGGVSGDLGVPGRAMQQPGCDGSYITILASAIGNQATPGGIAAVLETYPGSNYLRTDQTCPSLNPDVDGEPIYVVFFGPFAFDSDACAARVAGPDGAYARRLSTDLGPNHSVACA